MVLIWGEDVNSGTANLETNKQLRQVYERGHRGRGQPGGEKEA